MPWDWPTAMHSHHHHNTRIYSTPITIIGHRCITESSEVSANTESQTKRVCLESFSKTRLNIDKFSSATANVPAKGSQCLVSRPRLLQDNVFVELIAHCNRVRAIAEYTLRCYFRPALRMLSVSWRRRCTATGNSECRAAIIHLLSWLCVCVCAECISVSSELYTARLTASSRTEKWINVITRSVSTYLVLRSTQRNLACIKWMFCIQLS